MVLKKVKILCRLSCILLVSVVEPEADVYLEADPELKLSGGSGSRKK
jgi:hypothetical protein